jgi:hypothetical protein
MIRVADVEYAQASRPKPVAGLAIVIMERHEDSGYPGFIVNEQLCRAACAVG